MVFWKIFHQKLPTDEKFVARGFLGPSICSLCRATTDSIIHLFFERNYVTPIWNWLVNKIQHYGVVVANMDDCIKLVLALGSSQANVVVISCVCNFFYQVLKARNNMRFEGKKINWNTCVTHIMARAKLVGDTSGFPTNNSIHNFSILKGLNVFLLPRKNPNFINVLWSPPPLGWEKVNIDGVARGDPRLMSCRGIYCNDKAYHLGSFCDVLGDGSAELAELLATIIAIEKVVLYGWKKIWIETDCVLVTKALSDLALVPWCIRSCWLLCHAYSQSMNIFAHLS